MPLKKVTFVLINFNHRKMTNSLIAENQTSFTKKITTSLIAGITVSALLLVIGNGGNVFWFPPAVVFPLVGLALLTSIIYPFIWNYMEKKQKVNSIKIYGVFYTIIRYCIAINIASFGWKKIFGLQFLVPVEIANLPMNQQTGEWLTWYYFGYSETFGLIIAVSQIVGAYLLLFRRTLLLGSVVLFALMLNLTLINIFYQMNLGALLQSVISTIGILFLILLDYDRIKTFFFYSKSTLPIIAVPKSGVKNMLRLSVLIISMLFAIYLKTLLKV